jgi:hypothetical protein
MGMTPAIDVLLDARKLLARTDGWIQHAQTQMVNGTVAYCIEGALEAAAPEAILYSEASARVQGVVGYPIPAYNDVPGRQQSEVVEIIDDPGGMAWGSDAVGRGYRTIRRPTARSSGSTGHWPKSGPTARCGLQTISARQL